MRYLRVQRKRFRADDRALSRAEHQHLLRTARTRGWRQLALVVETLGATGIRVSELAPSPSKPCVVDAPTSI